jgi:ABC transporter substrate binding protein/Phage integrase family
LQAAARKFSRWGHRDATMILLGYRHGLRASELCDLQWSQVELGAGRLHVRRAKNGSPSVHPLRGDEIRALRRLQREQGQSPHVFMTERDAPMTPNNIVSGELTAKRLELLRELVPSVARVAVMVSPVSLLAEAPLRDVEPAARAMGMQTDIVNAGTSREIDVAFAGFVGRRPDALFIAADPFFTSRRVQLANSAARHGIPMIAATREIAEAGGLISYGSNVVDAHRQVGVYVGRILKGGNPADLPVVQSTKLELVINHQTARILGLTVPDKLLALADEVIE